MAAAKAGELGRWKTEMFMIALGDLNFLVRGLDSILNPAETEENRFDSPAVQPETADLVDWIVLAVDRVVRLGGGK